MAWCRFSVSGEDFASNSFEILFSTEAAKFLGYEDGDIVRMKNERNSAESPSAPLVVCVKKEVRQNCVAIVRTEVVRN